MPPVEITCPQCRKTTTWEGNENRPFCSARCRLLDLGAWADESYRLPGRSTVPATDQNKIDDD